MQVMGVDLYLVAFGIAAVFMAAFVLDWAMERDASSAADKTTRRTFGLIAGSGSVVLTMMTAGLDVIAEAPGLVIGLLGIGGILADVSIEVFAATALVTYIVLAGLRGE
jgi:hypothetical protein